MRRRIGHWTLLILCAGMASLDCLHDDPGGEALLNPRANAQGSLQYLQFGRVDVGTSLERRFVLRNRGTGLLVGEVASPCSEFVVVTDRRYLLAPGGSSVVVVRFSPPGSGAYVCTLDTGALCDTVVAIGSGVEGSALGCAVTASPTRGPSPLTVSLDASVVGAVSPYSVLWSFGDGSASTVQNTSHIFRSQRPAGSDTFDVVFRVTDSASAQCSTSTQIVVDPGTMPPLLCFADGPEFTPTNVLVQFTAMTEVATGAFGFFWDFGDGSAFSTKQNPLHSFERPGIFQVNLTVTDSLSGAICEDSLQTTVLGNI